MLLGILLAVVFFPVSAWADACLYEAARGRLLESRGEIEAAREAYKHAASGACLEAHLALARMAVQSGDWKSAEKSLRKALRIRPGDPTLSMRLAECYLAQKKHAWALRTLKGIRPDAIAAKDAPRREYLLGLTALEMDDPKTALEVFERIPKARRTDFPRLDYHRARALSASGRGLDARGAVELFLDDDSRDRRFDPAAQALFESTYADRKPDPPAALSLAASLRYDSNAVQDPSDEKLRTGKDPDSMALGLSAGLSVNPLRRPRHTLGADLTAGTIQYLYGPAMALSWLGGSVTPRYRTRFRTLGRDQEVSMGYSGQVGLLMGGERAEEDHPYVHNESHLGFFRWQLATPDFGDTFLRLGGGRKLYHYFVRDVWTATGTLGQSFFFLNQRLKLFLEAQGRFESARKKDYDRYRVGGFVGLSSLLPERISFTILDRYEYIDHFHSGTDGRWGAARSDHLNTLALSLSRSFLKDSLTPALFYQFTANVSSLDLFHYFRHVAGLSLTWRHAW